MAGNLTPKQQLFIEAYLGAAKGNATEAARLAGYKGNDVTLCAVGAENLRKPRIAEAVKDRLSENKNILSADEVLEGLSKIARNTNEETKDRIKAYELMGKHHKCFTDKVEHSGEIEAKVIRVPAKMSAEEWSQQQWAQPSESV